MARPKPNVLLELINKKTYIAEQILEADAIYAVFYQNKPINLRISNIINEYLNCKYKKVSFSNAGHAFNLASKLNSIFKTDLFTVVKLTAGETIKE
jgi:hypothetical protein